MVAEADEDIKKRETKKQIVIEEPHEDIKKEAKKQIAIEENTKTNEFL
jgi:3-deoxy-D-arabino-heptulosonate 7-phosphate (DAHP) synthase